MFNLPRGIVLLLSAVLAGLHAANAGTLDKIKESGALTLGYRENSLPMSYAGSPQPIGFALDLCAMAAGAVKQKLGLDELNIDYRPISQSGAPASLESGAIAIDCAATPIGPELGRQASFSMPVFVSELRWIAPRRLRVEREGRRGIRYETISPSTAEDLKGKPIVLTQGGGVGPLVLALSSDRSLGLSITEAKDDAESFKLLETGKASAFLASDLALVSLKATAKNPDTFGFLDDAYPGASYAFLLAKDDGEFKELVDSALTGAMQSGEYAKLYEKWFESPIPPRNVNLTHPMSAKLAELIKATAGKERTP